MPSKLQEQLFQFKQLLDGRMLTKDNKVFPAVLGWLRQYPGKLEEDEVATIRSLICRTFQLKEAELDQELAGVKPRELEGSAKGYAVIEHDLDELAPKEGFIRHYIDFTKNLESPYAFHMFSALVGVGAVVNRQVYIDMGGQFKIFPTMGVMILGPSGVKKTTATDVIVNMIQEAQLARVYQEKLTPEALVEAMKGENGATGLVYAPEMSVFLGKQRYLEGLVPLLTRFMDCPSTWSSGTILRGSADLHNVGISCLFCSTPDWFVKNTPADTFGGGFIARNVLIVQNGSPRIFPIPTPNADDVRPRLLEELTALHQLTGVMGFEPKVYHRNGSGTDSGSYVDWYSEFKRTGRDNPGHEMLATYMERKPTHMLRLAMVLHLAEHQTLEICEECFERAIKLSDYMEAFLPDLMQQMFKTDVGEDQQLILSRIRKAGGAITHTQLVRSMNYKMKAEQTKQIISSLKEAELVTELRDNFSRRYVLTEMVRKKEI